MKDSIFYLLLVFLCFSCSAKKPINSNKIKAKTESKGMFEQTTSFMICSKYPDIFQLETIEKKPLPIQGESQWIRDFYTALRYPPESREKGIQGTVILEIIIRADGSIESIACIQQVSPDIDKAAIDSFKNATAKGFTPAIFEGKAVRCKATVPLHFRLG